MSIVNYFLIEVDMNKTTPDERIAMRQEYDVRKKRLVEWFLVEKTQTGEKFNIKEITREEYNSIMQGRNHAGNYFV